MIADILLILFTLVLGYIVFMASAFFLAKWLLPTIDDPEGALTNRKIMRTVKDGRYVAQ